MGITYNQFSSVLEKAHFDHLKENIHAMEEYVSYNYRHQLNVDDTITLHFSKTLIETGSMDERDLDISATYRVVGIVSNYPRTIRLERIEQ